MTEKKRPVQIMLPESFYQEIKAEADRKSNTVPGFVRYMCNVYMAALKRNRQKSLQNHGEGQK